MKRLLICAALCLFPSLARADGTIFVGPRGVSVIQPTSYGGWYTSPQGFGTWFNYPMPQYYPAYQPVYVPVYQPVYYYQPVYRFGF